MVVLALVAALVGQAGTETVSPVLVNSSGFVVDPNPLCVSSWVAQFGGERSYRLALRDLGSSSVKYSRLRVAVPSSCGVVLPSSVRVTHEHTGQTLVTAGVYDAGEAGGGSRWVTAWIELAGLEYPSLELFFSVGANGRVSDPVVFAELAGSGGGGPGDGSGSGGTGTVALCGGIQTSCACSESWSFASVLQVPLPASSSFIGSFLCRDVPVSSAVGGTVLAPGLAVSGNQTHVASNFQYCQALGPEFVVSNPSGTVADYLLAWRWVIPECLASQSSYGAKRGGDGVTLVLERRDSSGVWWQAVNTGSTYSATLSGGLGNSSSTYVDFGPGCAPADSACLNHAGFVYRRDQCFTLPFGSITCRLRVVFRSENPLGDLNAVINLDDVLLCKRLTPCDGSSTGGDSHCCNCCCSRCESEAAPPDPRSLPSSSSLFTGASFSLPWSAPSGVGSRDTSVILPLATFNRGRDVFASGAVAKVSLDGLRSRVPAVESFRVVVRASLLIGLGFGLVFTIAKDLARD